jgi:hypothetical protein
MKAPRNNNLLGGACPSLPNYFFLAYFAFLKVFFTALFAALAFLATAS